MELVSFISVETGDDLILSFVIQNPLDPFEIESLILLRTPKYEFLFEDDERGVNVSFERYDNEGDLLNEVSFSQTDKTLEITTTDHTYELDLRKVDQNEVDAMRKMLHKMNFDHRVRLHGV